MKIVAIACVILLSACNSCSESFMSDPPPYNSDLPQAINDVESLSPSDIEEETVDPSTVYPFPNNSCVECQWYFCPPLDSVWQKQICIDRCEDPPLIAYEGTCEEYLECDPQQYLMDQVECVTEDGYPGMQEKVCNKGKIQYTDCITDCEEEACNYIDDDCDGEIDEGQLNACGECGVLPQEQCNGHDDNCDGTVDEDLIQPCYSACGAGFETCYDGKWTSCTAPPELEEICDGLDNDCDGQIDEDLECVCTIQDVGVLFPCTEDPLLCGQGYKTCQCTDGTCTSFSMSECLALCYWIPPIDQTCDPFIGMPLEEEKCNNFDDNCNQEIDEDLIAACYTGPEGTLMVGICEPGVMTCDAGTWGSYEDDQFIPYYCLDEIVPQQEICNGVDDDCDGIIDWGEEMKDTDVLFIVDWSGSMSDEINAVMVALNQFAQDFSDEDVIKWGLIRGPAGVPPIYYEERLELYQELVGFSDFLNSVATLNSDSPTMNTSMEMLLDAIYLSVHNISSNLFAAIADLEWLGIVSPNIKITESVPPLDSFSINWRANADRIIIVFSDEIPQSYLVPPLTSENIKDAVSSAPQLKLFTFSRTAHKGAWEEIAVAGNGEWYELTNNPTEMYAGLMSILDDICKAE